MNEFLKAEGTRALNAAAGATFGYAEIMLVIVAVKDGDTVCTGAIMNKHMPTEEGIKAMRSHADAYEAMLKEEEGAK